MITLRDYDAGDAPRLVELANNKNVSRYLIYTFPYPYTNEDAEWWIETALRQMTEQTFATTRFDKLFAPVLAPNRASMRVLEKNAYELEGVLKNEVEKDGQRFDIYHYARQRA